MDFAQSVVLLMAYLVGGAIDPQLAMLWAIVSLHPAIDASNPEFIIAGLLGVSTVSFLRKSLLAGVK